MKSPRLMHLYGLFLVVCGVITFALAGFDSKAVTALIPAGCGVLMFACGLMAGALHRHKAVGMIGIHVGLALPLIFAAMFAARGYEAWQAFEAGTKAIYLPLMLFLLVLGSVMAFMAILVTRPPKAMRT